MGSRIVETPRTHENIKDHELGGLEPFVETLEAGHARLSAAPPAPSVERLHEPIVRAAGPVLPAPQATGAKNIVDALLPKFESPHTDFALLHLSKVTSFDAAHKTLHEFAAQVTDVRGSEATVEMMQELDAVSDSLRFDSDPLKRLKKMQLAEALGTDYWAGMPRQWLRNHEAKLQSEKEVVANKEALLVTPHSSEADAEAAIAALRKHMSPFDIFMGMDPDGAKSPPAYLHNYGRGMALERGANGKFGIRLDVAAFGGAKNVATQMVRAVRAQLAIEGFADVSFRIENAAERRVGNSQTAEPVTIAALEAARRSGDEAAIYKALDLDNNLAITGSQVQAIVQKMFDVRQSAKTVAEIISSVVSPQAYPMGHAYLE